MKDDNGKPRELERTEFILKHGEYTWNKTRCVLFLNDKVVCTGLAAKVWALEIAPPSRWSFFEAKKPMYLDRGKEADDEMGYYQSQLRWEDGRWDMQTAYSGICRGDTIILKKG